MTPDHHAELDAILKRLQQRTEQVARLATSTNPDDADEIQALLSDPRAWMFDALEALAALTASPALSDYQRFGDVLSDFRFDERNPKHDLRDTLNRLMRRWAPRQANLSAWALTGELDYSRDWGENLAFTTLLRGLLISPDISDNLRATLTRQIAQAHAQDRSAAPDPKLVLSNAFNDAPTEQVLPLAHAILAHAPAYYDLVDRAVDRAELQLTEADLTAWLEPYLAYFTGRRATPPLGGKDDGEMLARALVHDSTPTRLTLDILQAWLQPASSPSDAPRLHSAAHHDNVGGHILAMHLRRKPQPLAGEVTALLAQHPRWVTAVVTRALLTSDSVLALLRAGFDPHELVPLLRPETRAALYGGHALRLPRGTPIDLTGFTHDMAVNSLKATGWDQALYEREGITRWPLELADNPSTSADALEQITQYTTGRRFTVAQAERVLTRVLKHPNCPPSAFTRIGEWLTTRPGRFGGSSPAKPPRILRLYLEQLHTPRLRAHTLNTIEALCGRAYHEHFPDLLDQDA